MLGAETLEPYNWIMLEDIFSRNLKSDIYFFVSCQVLFL